MLKHYRGFNLEPMAGFEPATSSLPRKCSTPELHRQRNLSGRRGSNSRPSAWKADALSTELLPPEEKIIVGRGWIRTTEGESQQIYSLPHLATLEHAQYFVASLNRSFQDANSSLLSVGFEPTTPRLQITCSGQLS